MRVKCWENLLRNVSLVLIHRAFELLRENFSSIKGELFCFRGNEIAYLEKQIFHLSCNIEPEVYNNFKCSWAMNGLRVMMELIAFWRGGGTISRVSNVNLMEEFYFEKWIYNTMLPTEREKCAIGKSIWNKWHENICKIVQEEMFTKVQWEYPLVTECASRSGAQKKDCEGII